MTEHDPIEALPGVFRCLARDGRLDPGAPALVHLAQRFAAVPDAQLFRTTGERIDQIGWPVAHDLAVALAACDRIAAPQQHPLVDAVLTAARTVLAEEPLVRDRLAQLRARLDMLALVARGHAVEDAATLAAYLPGDRDPDLSDFLTIHTAWSLEHPDLVVALAQLAGTAIGVLDGWFAFQAHRRLPSTAAECSARTVVAAAVLAGPTLLDDLLALAVTL